jgi:hypothetical protein
MIAQCQHRLWCGTRHGDSGGDSWEWLYFLEELPQAL